MYKILKNNLVLLIIIIIYSSIFCSISLVNHYNFRTAAWDLGINNNAIFDYAHFRWNNAAIMYPNSHFENVLGDHFSLLPILFSPLYWICGTYTMLIVQILGIVFGGIGIYKLIFDLTKNKVISDISVIFFYSIFGVYSALSFDYHDNVMAAMFVPWFFYYVYNNKWKYASIFCLLVLISKENMALWMFFICLGAIILFHKEKEKLKFLSFYAIFSVLYFYFIMKLMPAISPGENNYRHFDYSVLGKNMLEAIKTCINRPKYVFSLLFESPINDSLTFGIKSELHYAVLLSGGVVLLWKPQFLIMLLPIYGQKLFNDDFGKWSVGGHYSIEFVPILTIALFWWINGLNNFKIRTKVIISVLFTVICMKISYGLMEKQVNWFNKELIQFYSKNHWKREFNVKKVYEGLKIIPKNAKVSAQTMLSSHLSFREYIYTYPYVADADYIVLLLSDGPYPLNDEEYKKELNKYKESSEWGIIKYDYPLVIFKRGEKSDLSDKYKTALIKEKILFCDAEKVTDNKEFFIGNNADILFENGYTQCGEKAYNSKYSAKLTKNSPYGMTIKLKNTQIGENIDINVWRFSNDKKGIIVASSLDGKELYISGEKIIKGETNGWDLINLKFRIEKNLSKNTVMIYLWNNGNNTVYFDNLEIKRSFL
ncbi:MAG: DUF2079 domain-containing protein [Bacteroidales bacterium]|nr:DUF2079 domain-containing protein [Bacteroidales bacterium]